MPDESKISTLFSQVRGLISQGFSWINIISEYLENINIGYDEAQRITHIHIGDVASKRLLLMGRMSESGAIKSWQIKFWYLHFPGDKTLQVRVFQHFPGDNPQLIYNSGAWSVPSTAGNFVPWESTEFIVDQGKYVSVEITANNGDSYVSITDLELVGS
jgi:hypothetical protein